MPSKKPKSLAVTTDAAANGTHTLKTNLGQPHPLNISITGHSRPSQTPNTRVAEVMVQVFYRVGSLLFLKVCAAGPRAINDATSPTKFTASATFIPEFIGVHTIRVVAWNSKVDEKPRH